MDEGARSREERKDGVCREGSRVSFKKMEIPIVLLFELQLSSITSYRMKTVACVLDPPNTQLICIQVSILESLNM